MIERVERERDWERRERERERERGKVYTSKINLAKNRKLKELLKENQALPSFLFVR